VPRLALVVWLLWFVVLFGVRSLLQWRRTGSTGWKGFRGRVGSLPWLAGATVTLGFGLAMLAPLGAVLGWAGARPVLSSPALHLAGAALAVAGGIGALAAQLAMGDSWRVGVDESERTELVTGGLFAWVRNPIFSFIGVSALGLAMMVPSPLAVLAVLVTGLGIEVQVRAVEEPYLAKAHGDAYALYAAAVGRFVPGVGRLARG
jgi:protein-S-isoprenylcysteine O-methyltransferase Ste14